MQNFPTGTPRKIFPVSRETNKRHGCLTAWLILMIFAPVMFILLYLARFDYPQYSPDLSAWSLSILVSIDVIQIICTIALFKWKKWGFWVYCIACVMAFIANIWLGVVVTAVGILVSAVILYAVLNMGKDNNGWHRLN